MTLVSNQESPEVGVVVASAVDVVIIIVIFAAAASTAVVVMVVVLLLLLLLLLLSLLLLLLLLLLLMMPLLLMSLCQHHNFSSLLLYDITNLGSSMSRFPSLSSDSTLISIACIRSLSVTTRQRLFTPTNLKFAVSTVMGLVMDYAPLAFLYLIISSFRRPF